MNNKKQNSVEWLAKAIYEKMEMRGDGNVLQGILDEAKAMHKEEMDKVAGDWWNEGASYMHDGGRKYKNFEEYYNKTFEE